jgi:GNAT superfamily N-acetyltransferase
MGSFGTTSSAILRSEHGAGLRRPAFSIDLPVPPLEVARAVVRHSSSFAVGSEGGAREVAALPFHSAMIEIRPFVRDDTEAVVALWGACGLVRPWNDPRKDIERKLRVRAEMFLVAVEEGVIVGSVMAGYEGHRGWINYLAVEPNRRRQGLGTRLMAEAEQLLEGSGCPKINLQIRSENADVIAFYRALGYEADDVVSLGKRLISD